MSVNVYDPITKKLDPIAGCPSGGSAGGYTKMAELLSPPAQTDIDNGTGIITTEMDEGTATTQIVSENGVDTITVNIEMNEGDFDYVRTTTIEEVNGVDQIRTTLQKVPK